MSVNRSRPNTIYTVHFAEGEYESAVSLQKVGETSALLVCETTDGNFQTLVNPDQILALANTYVKDARQNQKEKS